MKIQATVISLLIGMATTFAEAAPTQPDTDVATSGWASSQAVTDSASAASAAPAANTQQPGSGALALQSGETSENDNTPRLVLLALLAMGSIALRRSGSAQ